MKKAAPRVLDPLASSSAGVAHLALALRELVLAEAPGVVERVYKNHPSAIWFGFRPKMTDMFCYIAAATNHVNLGFCRGASLPDPDRVLEGAGKTMRHIKFRSERDLERPFVRRYVRAAADQATADKEPRGPLPGGRGSVSASPQNS